MCARISPAGRVVAPAEKASKPSGAPRTALPPRYASVASVCRSISLAPSLIARPPAWRWHDAGPPRLADPRTIHHGLLPATEPDEFVLDSGPLRHLRTDAP